MKDDDPQFDQRSGKTLNWILAIAITLVACAIAWVGWNCIDSVQKNAGKLHNFHVTAENTKMDTHHYDVVKNEIDSQVLTNQLSPSQELQGALVKQEGSEVFFHRGIAEIDNKQYVQGIDDFSKVIAMVPEEARNKTSWFGFGGMSDRRTYTMWAYRQRATCYTELGDYTRALVDLGEAIKLRPDTPITYKNRARIYYRLGKRGAGDADMRIAREIMIKNPAPQYP
jgi:tetratricopeptide (TPR) repeat protein